MAVNQRDNSGMVTPRIMTREHASEEAPTQIYLQPIAAPSILGLFGFAGATFMVAAYLAHWYGTANTAVYLFPFAAIFGGLAQFLAGMWAFKARDGIATAMHGTWGSFWLAYGLLNGLAAVGAIKLPVGGLFAPLGYWFIVLAVITWLGTVAATGENRALVAVLAFLAAGSTAAAVANLIGSDAWMVLAGWLFIVSAAVAFYTAGALMINPALGRDVLPLGKTHRSKERPALAPGLGEPGVLHGQ
jgi:uncharacterized protein